MTTHLMRRQARVTISRTALLSIPLVPQAIATIENPGAGRMSRTPFCHPTAETCTPSGNNVPGTAVQHSVVGPRGKSATPWAC